MKIRKWGAVLFAVLMVSVVSAGNASAAAFTQQAKWFTGGAPGAEAELVGELGLKGTSSVNFLLKTTVGVLNTPLELESGELSCIECKISNSNAEHAIVGAALGIGRLEFKKVKVLAPAACKVAGELLLTNKLFLEAHWMEKVGAEEFWMLKFVPNLMGGKIGTFTLERGTGACPINGIYNFTGTFFGKATNKTNVQAVAQPVEFSNLINSNAGGALSVNAHAAELSGKATFEVETENPTKFGVH